MKSKKTTMKEFNESIVLNAALEGKTYHDLESIEEIKNATLKSKLKAYVKEENKGKKAAWEMVRLVASMADVIKEDFGSDYKFAEYMECSQATINKRKRLGNYAVDLQTKGYSDTQAMEMLPLLSKGEEIITNNIEDFQAQEEARTELVNQISDNISPNLTQKEIRKVAKRLTAFWDIDNAIPGIVEKEDVANTNTEGESLESSNSPSLDELDNTEPEVTEEQYIIYTVPWLEGNSLIDMDIEVSENVAKEIAKAIMGIMNE